MLRKIYGVHVQNCYKPVLNYDYFLKPYLYMLKGKYKFSRPQ